MMIFVLSIVAAVGLSLIALVAEAIIAGMNRPPAYHSPAHDIISYGGQGQNILLVVIGDSTGAGQGASYESGIAVQSARYLAKTRSVKMANFSVSGAKTAEVVTDQVTAAAQLHPDIMLVSSAANDITGLTSAGKVRDSYAAIAQTLKADNPGVRIIFTGSPNMGTSPRFLQPLRWVAGWRSARVNSVLYPWVKDNGYILAPIATGTTPAFTRDRTLFAVDRFHPNARGYAEWMKTLRPALDTATQL